MLECLKVYVATRKLFQGPTAADPGQRAELSPGGVVVHGNLNINNSVVNILTNPDVSMVVGKAATDIEADESIKEVKLLKGEEREPIAAITREELPKFRYDPNTPVLDLPKKELLRKTTVIVHTPVLEGNAMWKVIYEGTTINVRIEDDGFMRKVRAGTEAFSAGDRLAVDLIVVQEYSPKLNAYEGKECRITKVRKHHKRPKQKQFQSFDEDEPSKGN